MLSQLASGCSLLLCMAPMSEIGKTAIESHELCPQTKCFLYTAASVLMGRFRRSTYLYPRAQIEHLE
jgi:hypothetical protein